MTVTSHNTEVSVPGKLILMGEHAVVYGCPALVGAIDLRLRVLLSSAERGVRISLPGLGVEESADWPAIVEYARVARTRWQAFAERPSAEGLRRMQGDDPAHVVKVALGEAAGWCAEAERRPLQLEVRSELPVGSGFGSSAATAVGVVAGYLMHRGVLAARDVVDRLALEVERRQHGLPSGVDHATVLDGGLFWAVRAPDGRVRREALEVDPAVLERFRVYDSGRPAEGTGAVVAAVRERLGPRPDRTSGVLREMEAAVVRFRDQLEDDATPPSAVADTIREYERCLEHLGVVPEPVREVIRRIEERGGAAKVSGAGALSGPGGGGVLAYHPDPRGLDDGALLGRFRRLPVRLGAPGLRDEAVA